MKKLAILSVFLYASRAVGFSIILDTGHTEKNYGAVSPFNKTEFSYNKTMVTALQRHFSTQNIDVKLVSNTQPDLTLRQRTVYGDKTDLFVSIHHDSFPPELNLQREKQKNVNYAYSLMCAKSITLGIADCMKTH